MLDPAGLGVFLLMLLLIEGHDVAAMVEDHEASACGPLVKRSYVVRHVLRLLSDVSLAGS
jgi:hypothetical protein